MNKLPGVIASAAWQFLARFVLNILLWLFSVTLFLCVPFLFFVFISEPILLAR